MFTCYIVEDEKPAAERLHGFLKNINDLEFIGENTSAKKAIEEIEFLKPELLFLDINLPDISGIDLLHLLSHKPAVIFTTAYDQYAIQAFELRAVDYLLKPFSEERLISAVKKAKQKIEDNQGTNVELKKLLTEWNPQKNYLRRVPSKIGDKIYILQDDEIVYFASDNKLVFAFLADTKFMLNYTLEELNSRLDPEKFFRIHRSTIVNLNFVKTIESWFAGGYRMIVKDNKNSELMISRNAGKLLRQKLGW